MSLRRLTLDAAPRMRRAAVAWSTWYFPPSTPATGGSIAIGCCCRSARWLESRADDRVAAAHGRPRPAKILRHFEMQADVLVFRQDQIRFYPRGGRGGRAGPGVPAATSARPPAATSCARERSALPGKASDVHRPQYLGDRRRDRGQPHCRPSRFLPAGDGNGIRGAATARWCGASPSRSASNSAKARRRISAGFPDPAEMGEAEAGAVFQAIAQRPVDADMGEPDDRDRQHQRRGQPKPATISVIGAM